MPVAAKLSRKFYETFGDEIANELVEWSFPFWMGMVVTVFVSRVL